VVIHFSCRTLSCDAGAESARPIPLKSWKLPQKSNKRRAPVDHQRLVVHLGFRWKRRRRDQQPPASSQKTTRTTSLMPTGWPGPNRESTVQSQADYNDGNTRLTTSSGPNQIPKHHQYDNQPTPRPTRHQRGRNRIIVRVLRNRDRRCSNLWPLRCPR
jgi:hypothetical protein